MTQGEGSIKCRKLLCDVIHDALKIKYNVSTSGGGHLQNCLDTKGLDITDTLRGGGVGWTAIEIRVRL